MTRQRQAVLDEVQFGSGHPTADEIHTEVRKKLPHMSLGTVYRGLEVLHQAGLIRKLDLGEGQKHYDCGLDKHYHVRCIRCGRIGDIAPDPIPDLDRAVDGQGFRILAHQLTFEGLCSTCQTVE